MDNLAVNEQTNFLKVSHHTALVNGVQLHYVLSGAGELIVLLHGCPQTWFEWRNIIPALAAKYTVVAPDLRGLGDSSKPVNGYDKRTVAADIFELIAKLGHKRVFLVGHDVGAGVAYALAAAHPELVRRLVYMEFPLPGFGLEKAMDVLNGGLWHFGFHMAEDVPETLVTGRERMYLEMFYRRDAYDKAAITAEDVDEFVRCYSQPGALRAFFNYYRSLPTDVEHNRENARTKLEMPILALGGASSMGERAAESIGAVAENVRGRVVEKCGHWIPHEQPEFLTQQLLEFFAEESSGEGNAAKR